MVSLGTCNTLSFQIFLLSHYLPHYDEDLIHGPHFPLYIFILFIYVTHFASFILGIYMEMPSKLLTLYFAFKLPIELENPNIHGLSFKQLNPFHVNRMSMNVGPSVKRSS